ncbi:MAG: hypothetical protein NVSMB24_10810 [Mucilaginibacter sp.]
MKSTTFILALLFSVSVFAQKHTPMPQGTVYGAKPDNTAMVTASNLESYMNNKTRVSTTIRGRVIKVTKAKGGWFQIEAGKRKVIMAHFRDYNITLPEDIKGKYVIAEGIAAKQFIADDMQHLAGDAATRKKGHADKDQQISFEVKGLLVEK